VLIYCPFFVVTRLHFKLSNIVICDTNSLVSILLLLLLLKHDSPMHVYVACFNTFILPQPMEQHSLQRQIMFVPLSRCLPVSSIFLSLRKNNERILMKFAGSRPNHHHKQIKLYSWQNCIRDKGTGYDRKFESTSTGVAAM